MGAGCTCGVCGHRWSSWDPILDPFLITFGLSGSKRGVPPKISDKIVYVTIYFSVGLVRAIPTPSAETQDISMF